MLRHVPAAVQIPIVLRHHIHVMEEETVEVGHLQRLYETDVHQRTAIEGLIADLLHHEDPVVALLPLEERMQIQQEEGQMIGPIAVRDDDGDFLSGRAVVRVPLSARVDPVELELHIGH